MFRRVEFGEVFVERENIDLSEFMYFLFGREEFEDISKEEELVFLTKLEERNVDVDRRRMD